MMTAFVNGSGGELIALPLSSARPTRLERRWRQYVFATICALGFADAAHADILITNLTYSTPPMVSMSGVGATATCTITPKPVPSPSIYVPPAGAASTGMRFTGFSVDFKPDGNLEESCTVTFTMQGTISIVGPNTQLPGLRSAITGVVTTADPAARYVSSNLTTSITNFVGVPFLGGTFTAAEIPPPSGKATAEVFGGPANPIQGATISGVAPGKPVAAAAVAQSGHFGYIVGQGSITLGSGIGHEVVVNFPGSFDSVLCPPTSTPVSGDVCSLEASNADAPLPPWSIGLLGIGLIGLAIREQKHRAWGPTPHHF